MIFSDHLNWAALAWFFLVWIGYTAYANHAAGKKDCLARMLSIYRFHWMRSVLRREGRIADIALMGSMTQLTSFLASTTILIIAGTLTALFSTDSILKLLSGHEFVVPLDKEQIQFKLGMIGLIFVFAFFRLTWSLRQYTFCAMMLGAAPYVNRPQLTEDEEGFARHVARVCDRAAQDFNYGLRSYYFALAFLTWFISPWAMMTVSTLVVWVLYRREFYSTTLKYLVESQHRLEAMWDYDRKVLSGVV